MCLSALNLSGGKHPWNVSVSQLKVSASVGRAKRVCAQTNCSVHVHQAGGAFIQYVFASVSQMVGVGLGYKTLQ